MDLDSEFIINRFYPKAENYHKYRPGYPIAAIEKIIADLPLDENSLAVDVGAGTGISAWLLAEAGMRIIAIEANAKMLAMAKSHSRIQYQLGQAENLDLANNSVDLITSFQAFHWFASHSIINEFHRVLKPLGKIALVWNDLNLNDRFTREYKQVIRSVSDNSTSEQLHSASTILMESDLFINQAESIFPHTKQLSYQMLIGLVKSISWFPEDEEIQQQVFSRLSDLFAKYSYQNLVELHYCTYVYTAIKPN